MKILARLALPALVGVGIWLALAGSTGGKRPAITIVSPADGAQVAVRVRLTVRVPDKTTRVAFFLDGRRVFLDRSPPWRFRRTGYLRVSALKVGRHRLTVSARQKGGRLISSIRQFRVTRADRSPPSAAFRGPKTGQTVSGRLNEAAGDCEVVAADRSGIDRVDFFLDGRLTKPDRERPYRCEIDSARYPNGAHTLKAKTYDRAGNVSITSARLVFDNGPDPVASPVPRPPPGPPLLYAGFEDGLEGWSTGGAGDAIPTVVSDITREGSKAARIILTGKQIRSELILEKPDGSDIFEFKDGDQYWYGFSFYVVSMLWGRPGAHNVIWQLHQRGTGNVGSPPLALGLVDYQGKRGLWTHGSATGGARFLRPISLGRWYDVAVRFTVSSHGEGSYDYYLDGEWIDARSGVNTLIPGFTRCMIQTGLYRNGDELTGTSETRLDSVRLGRSMADIEPR